MATQQQLEHELSTAVTGREYQAFWTTEASGWLAAVLSQVSTWLRRPLLGLDVNVSSDGDLTLGDRRVQVLHRRSSGEHGVRVQVWNTNQGTTFVTTALAVEGSRGGGWLLLQTTSSDRAKPPLKPALVEPVLEVVEFRDGAPVSAGTRHISLAGLDDLEELLNHPERRLPVIAAAPVPGLAFDLWHHKVEQWTRRCTGIAHVVSLDPPAAAEFQQRHPAVAVQPGTLRTFPPTVRLDDPTAKLASRWLSPTTLTRLADSGSALQRLIESFVRRSQVDHALPLPTTVREWNRAFDRIAAQRTREAVAPRRTPLAQQIADRRAAGPQPAAQTATPQAEPATAPVIDLPPAPAEAPGVAGAAETILTATRQAAAVEADKASQSMAMLVEQLAAYEVDNTALRARLDHAAARASESQADVERVRQHLYLNDLSDESLDALLDSATREIPDASAVEQLLGEQETLRRDFEALEDAFQDQEADLAELHRTRDRLDVDNGQLERLNSWLRAKLDELQPGLAHTFVDDTDSPENPLGDTPASWDDLIDQLDALRKHGIVFTGNTRKMKDLAGLDRSGAGLSACWDALGTMVSYRQARINQSWDSNMHDFCTAGPPGTFHLPVGKHAHDETSLTRNDSRMARERALPVPPEVSRDGSVHMWAHFKPYEWSAHQKLRVHYYDQVSEDGFIYVGYIGHHLTSGSTEKVRR